LARVLPLLLRGLALAGLGAGREDAAAPGGAAEAGEQGRVEAGRARAGQAPESRHAREQARTPAAAERGHEVAHLREALHEVGDLALLAPAAARDARGTAAVDE